MNEVVIMAGSDYGNNAAGGVAIVVGIFGFLWLIGLVFPDKKNKRK
jgi:hypothetical protein